MAVNRFIYSEMDLEKICKMLDNDPKLIQVRAQIKKALDKNPKNVTFEQALEQVKKFRKCVN